MDTIDNLKKLGLTEKEAQFYVTALKLGHFSIASIATASSLKRPTCYLLVESLMKKGLIILIPRARKKIYMAESPEKLADDIALRAKIADSIIPSLKKLLSTEKDEPMIKFYRGEQGVRNIYNDFLNYKDIEIYSIFSAETLFSVTGQEFLNDWVKKRVARNIKALSIELNEPGSKDDFEFGSNDNKLREVRYLPYGVNLPGALCAYKSKVAFISGKETNYSFVVESRDYYESIKGIFDLLWNKIAEKQEKN